MSNIFKTINSKHQRKLANEPFAQFCSILSVNQHQMGSLELGEVLSVDDNNITESGVVLGECFQSFVALSLASFSEEENIRVFY